MSEIELYMQRLEGKIACLPRGYWTSITIRQVIKYLLEDYLKYDREQITKNFSVAFLKKYKLEGIMKKFNGSPYNILNHVYPNEFKPWELSNAPVNTWDEETAIEAFKWLIEDKLKWTREDVVENYCKKTLIDNGLKSILYLYSDSPYNVLNAVYSGEYKPWELSNAPWNTWNDENAAAATKWLFEEKLKWNEEEIKLYATRKCFISNGLAGLMKCYTSVYELLQLAYPGKFKEEELKHKTKK